RAACRCSLVAWTRERHDLPGTDSPERQHLASRLAQVSAARAHGLELRFKGIRLDVRLREPPQESGVPGTVAVLAAVVIADRLEQSGAKRGWRESDGTGGGLEHGAYSCVVRPALSTGRRKGRAISPGQTLVPPDQTHRARSSRPRQRSMRRYS